MGDLQSLKLSSNSIELTSGIIKIRIYLFCCRVAKPADLERARDSNKERRLKWQRGLGVSIWRAKDIESIFREAEG
jgi:hypothetical protein